MKKGLLLFVWMTCFMACHSSHLFYHIHNLPNGIWRQNNKMLFLADLEEIIPQPEVLLLLRFNPNITADSMRLSVLIAPSIDNTLDYDNKEAIIEQETSIVFDQESYHPSNKAWDNVVDLEIPLTLPSDFSFDQIGTYAIEIEKQMPEGDLPLLYDVGLEIRHQ